MERETESFKELGELFCARKRGWHTDFWWDPYVPGMERLSHSSAGEGDGGHFQDCLSAGPIIRGHETPTSNPAAQRETS